LHLWFTIFIDGFRLCICVCSMFMAFLYILALVTAFFLHLT
jgi:hypothetical protein